MKDVRIGNLSIAVWVSARVGCSGEGLRNQFANDDLAQDGPDFRSAPLGAVLLKKVNLDKRRRADAMNDSGGAS